MIEGIQLSWFLNTIYALFLIVASPWLLWRAISGNKNQRGWAQKLLGFVPNRNSNHELIWFHAVSVGEVNLLAPVLADLKFRSPQLRVAISTTTETGFDLANKKHPEHTVFFCPMDFTWAINRVLKRIRPSMLVLAELELWPNLISTTHAAGIPVAVINGRLSKNSFKGYSRLKWIVGPTFRKLSMVGAQNRTYADRFCQLGCDRENVVVTGNVKFDGVQTDRDNDAVGTLRRLAGVTNEEFVFVAGSTQLEEDLIAAQAYQSLRERVPNLRLILVPRHPERCGTLVERLIELNLETVRRSNLTEATPFGDTSEQTANSEKPILIVDVIGELGSWWGVANASFVGGSMGKRGGQNMIEPAAFGIPVSFGPNTVNFRQIVEELLIHDAATVVADQAELTSFIEHAFMDREWSKATGARGKKVVLRHVGASQRTIDCLCTVMPELLPQTTAPEASVCDTKVA